MKITENKEKGSNIKTYLHKSGKCSTYKTRGNTLLLLSFSQTQLWNAISMKTYFKNRIFTVFVVTENEDSDPSEESSRSKSSHEDKKGTNGKNSRGENMTQHFPKNLPLKRDSRKCSLYTMSFKT